MTTTTDTAYALRDDWQQAWQPMIEAIGQDFSGGVTNTAIDAVEQGAIRKYCEPIELGCPLHYEAAVARQHGYRDIVAPVSGIAMTWTHLGLWKLGMPTNYPNAEPNWDSSSRNMGGRGEIRPPAPPTTASTGTDIEIEYFEPVCVGDRLSVSGNQLVSVVPRETRVGRGAFITSKRQVHNQRGELVAQMRNGSYQYVRHERASGLAQPTQPSGPIMAALPPTRPIPAPRTVDWDRQLHFENVQEGDSVPPVVFNLTVFRFVVEAGANRDFNQIHHNTPATQETGAPDIYAGNVFVQGMWERTVRDYIGVAGRFKRTGPFRMNIFNTVGESVITSGSVKRKWIEGGEHLLELEMRSEHSRGVSVGPAPVIVTLPSRGT